jgi:protein SCO1/2
MGQQQKILTTALWAILVLSMVCVIAKGLWPAPAPPHVLFDAPEFSLTDQNGRTVSNRDLRGHVWICDFIFIHCAGPCPLMSQDVVGMEKTITDPSVRFVSFTVDPEHDTPAALKQYAEGFGGDESRWSLLTGTHEQMFAVADAMHMTAKAATAADPVMHDVHFLLIDAQGKVRDYYNSYDPARMKRLPIDTAALIAAGGSS